MFKFAGVNPMVGLWSGVFVGLITAIFGGRPGMICGATGAIALVAAKAFQHGKAEGAAGIADGLISSNYSSYDIGMQYLVAALLFAGLFQILFGVFKLGRLVRLIPHTVMMGFVNGLAIMIFLGQALFFKQKTGLDDKGDVALSWLGGSDVTLMLGLIILTMAIIQFLPKLTKAVPSTLVAIMVIFGISLIIPGVRDIRGILEMLSPTDTADISSSFPPISDLSQVPWLTKDFYN